jgi:3-deoxy-D-manno-octulosonic-acid transferase
MNKAPIAFRFYRFVADAARPLIPLFLLERTRRNKEDRTRLGERRGEPSRSRPGGPVVWVHGASVGECLSLLPLIEEMASREISVIVTSGTVTSANVLARRLPEGATHQYLPLDVALYARRFLDHWQPELAIFAESEIWPNILNEVGKRNIPMVLANARISDRSFRRWRHFPDLSRFLFERFDLCLAQTHQDAERLVRLGASRVSVTGNLKFDSAPPPASPLMVAGLEALIGARPVWLAASTHAGEEYIVIEAHRALAEAFPDLLTMIAPRHPDRGREVANAVARSGLSASQRSVGLLPDSATDIYIADTIGEMGLFYRLAPLVFLGGSLVPHGGQNPIEPAKLGAALLHGPYVHNFAEIYAMIDAAGGAILAHDAQELAESVGGLLRDTAALRDTARRANEAVLSIGGALQRTMAEIAPYLLKMHLGG